MTERLQQVEALPALPGRPDDGHKGTFGTVIVVGGSPTMIGAPAIAAGAALRAGTGLAKIATWPAVLPFAIAIEPSATGVLLEGHLDASLRAIEEADRKGRAVLAVGPGLGQGESAAALVRALLHGSRAMVLDADGLNLLARSGRPRHGSTPPLVMTPHPGEFARLAKPLGIEHSPTDEAQRPEAAAALAKAHHAVVVLKGRHTVVSDGRQVYLNRTGNAALATAGSGDVLTGVIASLMGQGLEPFDAAVLGVHVHGLGADDWAQRFGPAGLTARQLIDLLPAAMHRLRTVSGR